MIVVDTNVIAYLHIPGERMPLARRAFEKDPEWVAPILWRSEFRNVLAGHMRQRGLPLEEAARLMREAELLFRDAEHTVDSGQVLRLVSSSRCSAYDCEFVALAQQLDVRLVTTDDLILKEFPAVALSLDAFASE